MPVRAKGVRIEREVIRGLGLGVDGGDFGEGTGRNLIKAGGTDLGREVVEVGKGDKGDKGEGRLVDGGRIGKFCCCFRYRSNKVGGY